MPRSYPSTVLALTGLRDNAREGFIACRMVVFSREAFSVARTPS
jgi:hypothetical protein